MEAGWRGGSEAGGAGGTRTPDIRLAKAALSQLSYGPECSAGDQLSRRPAHRARRAGRSERAWWAILDSNQGPQSYQDCALTT